MGRSLLDLANDLDKKANLVETAASDLAVEIAMVVITDLANTTPVDTSKALSNWIVTLGSPTNQKVPAHFKGSRGSTKSASVAQTIANARDFLKKKKPGQTIYISNRQPYIKRLNEGYSGQAPAGFVQRAVLLGRRAKSKFKLKGFRNGR